MPQGVSQPEGELLLSMVPVAPQKIASVVDQLVRYIRSARASAPFYFRT